MKTDMNPKHNVIAMVYDFDGTLSPNNMQEDTIFKAYQIQKEELWKKSEQLVRQGFERTLAYLHLLIHDKPFQKKPLTRKELKNFASGIVYYPGVPTFFENINHYIQTIPEVKKWGITLEHYIISSGMLEILEGIKLFKVFKKIYACEYEYDDKGPIFPKLVINDTNKTQFLFRINKGRLDLSEDINTHMPEQERRIPFRNMIYIGDSETDIPSMTVIKKYGGHAIAVFNPANPVTEKIKAMVAVGRVDHFAPADF
ncbi:MAG: hypothetical protein A2Z83_05185, partial [Omnitrophica bacterium GWA2_52_8]